MAAQEPLIRPPLQRRSQESLERVMHAGLEVLKDVGFEGFTLQEVSRRAGVSIGSIYARASSKDALILAIYDRAMAQVTEQAEGLRLVSARGGPDPRELLGTLVTDMAQVFLANATTLRVFMRQAPVDPEIFRRGAQQSQIFADVFFDAVMAHRKVLNHSQPQLAVDVAYRFVYCTLARRITHGPTFESTREVSDKRLVQELARAVADYLLGPEASPPPKRVRARRT